MERYGFTKKFTWDIKADTMGKRTSSPQLKSQLISAGVKSVEALFAHYPGIEKKVSALEFMAARQDISEEAFKGVDPMKGAIKLVKGLVSHP